MEVLLYAINKFLIGLIDMSEQQNHLLELLEKQNTLIEEINSLNTKLTTKRDLLLKVQGIIEYLDQLGVTLDDQKQEDEEEEEEV